ncbi:MAG: hypothetical protein HRT88_05415, partial [Lentisphaeraceae bacterium]|nr:hypothetical protein [Lentisphaeraceae bacterium]
NNSFREDLFYRINTFSLQVPPLRERKEEIQVLCDYLITKLCEKLKIAFHSYHNSFQQVLLQHDWPGNVRELRNELERSLIIAAGKSPLKLHLRSKRHESYHGGLDEQTKQIIITALRQCGGKVHGVGGAAELLKLNPQTLYSKIRKMDISI